MSNNIGHNIISYYSSKTQP